VRYKLLSEYAVFKKMREGDAGFDLATTEDIEIKPLSSGIVPLGVAVAIPEGQYGLLTHRSSLAFKKGGILSTGIIDSNFRQEMKAKIFNQSEHYSLILKAGDRVAQLVIHEYISPELELVEEMEDGKGGFGSSGS